MRFILYFAISVTLLSACRVYSYLDEYNVASGPAMLPKLKVITDQEIFHNGSEDDAYDYARSLGSSRDLYNIERQFNKYVTDHLSSSRSEKAGYAVLRINHLKVRNHLSLLSVAAIASVGLTALVGIPAGRYVVEMDVSMEILDNDQQILGTFNGRGKESALIAMYYGYSEKDAREKCIYEALEMVFEQINERVMRDYDYLDGQLKKSISSTKGEE